MYHRPSNLTSTDPPSPFSPHTPSFSFSFKKFRSSRRHRRPHRTPALDRAQSAPRAGTSIPANRGALRPAFGRVRAPFTSSCVPRCARARSAALGAGGGHVRVGQRADVRDARGGDVARFGWRDCRRYEHRAGGRRCA